jgi:hypothetical protein
MHQWIVLLHLVGAFVFVASHGVAVWMSVQLSRERDPRRIAALLDLSSISLGGVYGGLALLLIGGIWAGIDGGFFGRGWIWAAIAILVVIMVAMYAIATPYFRRLRAALGMAQYGAKDVAPPTPLSDSEILAIAARSPVALLTIVGSGGLLIILWLMVFKPF